MRARVPWYRNFLKKLWGFSKTTVVGGQNNFPWEELRGGSLFNVISLLVVKFPLFFPLFSQCCRLGLMTRRTDETITLIGAEINQQISFINIMLNMVSKFYQNRTNSTRVVRDLTDQLHNTRKIVVLKLFRPLDEWLHLTCHCELPLIYF